MLERRDFEDPNFRDFGLIERSYYLSGHNIATLEEYPEYYSIYWQVSVGVTAFAERVEEIINTLRRTTAQDDLAIHGFAAAQGGRVHEALMPPQSTTLRDIVHHFPNASFLRVDTAMLDAWVATQDPDVPLNSTAASETGGIISRYNLTAAVAQLHAGTNAAATTMNSEQRNELRQELNDELDTVLNRFAYVEYAYDLDQQTRA